MTENKYMLLNGALAKMKKGEIREFNFRYVGEEKDRQGEWLWVEKIEDAFIIEHHIANADGDTLYDTLEQEDVGANIFILLETSKYARKIAAFIYATAVLEQEESNWVIYQSEIEERFEELPEGWAHDEQMLADIEQELSQYPGLDGAEFTIDQDDEGEVYFDIMLWTDYIASDYNAE